MIQIQDVSFEYEKEQGTLSHVDLNIQQGECVVLTGESSCGKTTVTKLIKALLDKASRGRNCRPNGRLFSWPGKNPEKWRLYAVLFFRY